MEKVNRSVRRLLFAALLSTALFVIGIPALIIGATHTDSWGAGGTALMVAGIVATAADFYAAPILWVTYGNRRTLAHHRLPPRLPPAHQGGRRPRLSGRLL